MTRKKPELDLAGVCLDDVETVSVPRPLVEEMSQAIAAMQKLAADGMVGVAKGLGLVARRPRKVALPACEDCDVDVAVGLPHLDGCASDEAVRYRATTVIPLDD